VRQKLFFGESRYKCQLGSSNTVTAYAHGQLIAQHTQQNAANVGGDLMMWASTGIAMADAGAIDYKPACYSHYLNHGVEVARMEHGNWATSGFLLAKDVNGVYKNSCTNCEYGVETLLSDDYTHYNTPKFHNYGYDKPGSGCNHINSDGSESECPTQCPQDDQYFNTGPGGNCGPNSGSWRTYYNECDTWN